MQTKDNKFPIFSMCVFISIILVLNPSLARHLCAAGVLLRGVRTTPIDIRHIRSALRAEGSGRRVRQTSADATGLMS